MPPSDAFSGGRAILSLTYPNSICATATGRRSAAKTKTAERKTPPKAKAGSRAQFERFVETAREIGVDEDAEALNRAFDKIAPSKPSPL